MQARNTRRSCSNCGRTGHVRSECIDPITSLGIISFHIDGYAHDDYRMLFHDLVGSDVGKIRLHADSKEDSDDSSTVQDQASSSLSAGGSISAEETSQEQAIVTAFTQRVRFVMVSRRHSLGLIEFVRGNYNEENPATVKHLFRQMLSEEIVKIARAKTYRDVCGIMIDPASHLWATASARFKRLHTDTALPYNLAYYTSNIDPEFHTPEIGPPGGHRNNGELACVCAKREFREETRCTDDEFTVLSAVYPLVENLIGTDRKRYRRIYYLAYMENPVELRVDPESDGQKHEIGQVFYCSYDHAMMLIRPRHVERRNIFSLVFMFLMGRILKLEKYKLAYMNGTIPNAIADKVDVVSKDTTSHPEPAAPSEPFLPIVPTEKPAEKPAEKQVKQIVESDSDSDDNSLTESPVDSPVDAPRHEKICTTPRARLIKLNKNKKKSNIATPTPSSY